MFGKKKPQEIALISLDNNSNEVINQVSTDGNFRYAIIKKGKYAREDSNPKKVLTTKEWVDVNGYWDAEIKDVISYIQNISTVDYKFGDGEVLIRYEIIPVKHESKLTHEYKIGE